MKPTKILTFFIVLLLVFVSASCSGSISTANIKDAYTIHQVNGQPERTTVFSQEEVFYLVVELANAPDDTVTSAKWYAMKADGVEPNTVIEEVDFTGGDTEITFDLSNDQLWPIGQYKVEVFLNGKSNTTVEFSVIPSPTAAAEAGQGQFMAYMASKSGGSPMETYVFSPDEPFYAIVDLSTVSEDTTAKAVWTAVDVEGVELNTFIDEAEIQGQGELTFDLTNNGSWPPGIYQVEIYINGELDSTMQFAVNANGTTGTAEVVDVYLVRENGDNFDPTVSYSQNEAFHCLVRLASASPATNFSANWIALDVEGLGTNEVFFTSEGTSDTDEFVFDLSNPNPWPSGEYRVEIYADGVLTKSADFSVE